MFSLIWDNLRVLLLEDELQKTIIVGAEAKHFKILMQIREKLSYKVIYNSYTGCCKNSHRIL